MGFKKLAFVSSVRHVEAIVKVCVLKKGKTLVKTVVCVCIFDRVIPKARKSKNRSQPVDYRSLS